MNELVIVLANIPVCCFGLGIPHVFGEVLEAADEVEFTSPHALKHVDFEHLWPAMERCPGAAVVVRVIIWSEANRDLMPTKQNRR